MITNGNGSSVFCPVVSFESCAAFFLSPFSILFIKFRPAAFYCRTLKVEHLDRQQMAPKQQSGKKLFKIWGGGKKLYLKSDGQRNATSLLNDIKWCAWTSFVLSLTFKCFLQQLFFSSVIQHTDYTDVHDKSKVKHKTWLIIG